MITDADKTGGQEESNSQMGVTESRDKNTISKYLLNDKVTKAEVLWVLQTVFTHASLRGAGSDVLLFKEMFSDSEIAAKMEMGRTKIAYTISYGLAPFFLNQIFDVLSSCTDLVIGFDETLNKVSQRQQLDVCVRFFDDTKQEVRSAYIGSAFLSSTRAVDLLDGLKSCLKSNPVLLTRVIQVSMDGPNVNLKLAKDLTTELRVQRGETFELLNLGSCGLHVVHNSFKSGMKEAEWRIDEFLQSLFYLFRDVPLRRADYTSITASTLFPLKFCAVRWVENQSVAERAYEMLPKLKVYVKAVNKQIEKKWKDSHPDYRRSFAGVSVNKNFKVVAAAVIDKFFKAKLAFFMSAAASVEPFLKKFQSEEPMVPFLYDDLIGLVQPVLEKVVKPEILKSTTLKSLCNIQLTEANLLSSTKVNIGFAAKVALNELKLDPAGKDVLLFRTSCKAYFVGFLKKMFERSPLTYPFTRFVTCLNPELIAHSPDIAKKRLQFCLETVVEKGHMAGSSADKAKDEYAQLICLPSFKHSLSVYRRTDRRVDHFWMTTISDSGKALEFLKSFLQKILILSHGNASSERGFSINKDCLVVNQLEESLVAQRIVYDAVSNAGGVSKVPIDKSLVQYARNAHSRYKEALEAQRKKESEKKQQVERKREAAKMINDLENKKAKILTDAEKEVSLLDEKLKQMKQ